MIEKEKIFQTCDNLGCRDDTVYKGVVWSQEGIFMIFLFDSYMNEFTFIDSKFWPLSTERLIS